MAQSYRERPGVQETFIFFQHARAPGGTPLAGSLLDPRAHAQRGGVRFPPR